MSPAGRRFDQQLATQFSQESHLIIIRGHYEGIDHRVVEPLVNLRYRSVIMSFTNGAIAAVVLVERRPIAAGRARVTKNRRPTIRSAPVCWRPRNTRARPIFAVECSERLLSWQSF